MTRREFKRVVQLVRSSLRRDDELTSSLEKVFGGPFISRLNDNMFSLTTLFFTFLFGGDDAEIIDWWMWENDFGGAGMKMRDADGKEIPVTTTDELFNYLIGKKDE